MTDISPFEVRAPVRHASGQRGRTVNNCVRTIDGGGESGNEGAAGGNVDSGVGSSIARAGGVGADGQDCGLGTGDGPAWRQEFRNHQGEVAVRAFATAAVIFGPIGLARVENQSMKRPSRPIRYLWKFHFGRPRSPACSPAHL